MKRIHPAHIGLAAICIIAILLGYFTAKANGAEERPEWVLLRVELSGQEPDKVAPESLTAAMLAVMMTHPEQTMPVFQTSVVIACNSKVRPKRAVVFVLYGACQLIPAYTEQFVAIARDVCPQSGAAEKVVIPKKEEIGDDLVVGNFGGLTPPPDIFSPVTPVVDVRPSR